MTEKIADKIVKSDSEWKKQLTDEQLDQVTAYLETLK